MMSNFENREFPIPLDAFRAIKITMNSYKTYLFHIHNPINVLQLQTKSSLTIIHSVKRVNCS